MLKVYDVNNDGQRTIFDQKSSLVLLAVLSYGMKEG